MLHFCISGTARRTASAPRAAVPLENNPNISNEQLTGENINIEESERELDAMFNNLNSLPSSPQQIEMMPLPPPPPSPSEAESSLRLLISSISPVPPLLSKDIKK